MSGEKLNFSKPEELQTRDGRTVRIYATDGQGPYAIHGAVLNTEGWTALKWTLDGRNLNCEMECRNDIVTKPARVTGWVNVFPGFIGRTAYKTKEQAESVAVNGIGQIYIDSEIT